MELTPMRIAAKERRERRGLLGRGVCRVLRSDAADGAFHLFPNSGTWIVKGIGESGEGGRGSLRKKGKCLGCASADRSVWVFKLSAKSGYCDLRGHPEPAQSHGRKQNYIRGRIAQTLDERRSQAFCKFCRVVCEIHDSHDQGPHGMFRILKHQDQRGQPQIATSAEDLGCAGRGFRPGSVVHQPGKGTDGGRRNVSAEKVKGRRCPLNPVLPTGNQEGPQPVILVKNFRAQVKLFRERLLLRLDALKQVRKGVGPDCLDRLFRIEIFPTASPVTKDFEPSAEVTPIAHRAVIRRGIEHCIKNERSHCDSDGEDKNHLFGRMHRRSVP